MRNIFNYQVQFCQIDSIGKYLRFKMRYFNSICIHYQGQWATVTWGADTDVDLKVLFHIYIEWFHCWRQKM